MNDIIGDILMPRPKRAKLSAVCSPMETYKSYLKHKYLEKEMPDYGKWPPSTAKKCVNLAVIEKKRLSRAEVKKNSKALTYGDVDKIMRKADIKLADIATPGENGALPKFVLIEGAPGVGKSTFAWKACRKWAKGKILTEYELVILIQLRDESVRKAACLGDLIQYPRDPTIHQNVVDEVTKTGGKGVLLLFEGYDELPASLRKEDSLFNKVIKGYFFDEGTVVVTSRPWASQPFLLPHFKTKRPLSKHVEILGFNKENIEDYLLLMAKDDSSLLHDLKHYLEFNPHIHSMMYIPLNCAIVLEVYRSRKMRNSPIPTTMTELYSSLLRSLLLRHICDLPEYEDKCPELSDLSKLPECIKSHFDKLAKLAYEGICKKDQQIIFTQDEMPSNLDPLGLMQSSMELYIDSGTRKSFSFLHLTIQEFLAAYHLLTFPSSEHVKLFHLNSLSSVLLRFLAGLSPSALESALGTYLSLEVTMDTIHWLFEAELKLHQKYLLFHEDRFKFHPMSYYMLGSVITNTCCHWDVHIEYDYERFRMFTHGIISCENKHVVSKLKLHIKLEMDADLCKFYDAPIAIELLELQEKPLELLDDHMHIISNCNKLSSFFDKLSKGAPLTIRHLQFAGIGLACEVSAKIESFLKSTSSTTHLTLYHSRFRADDQKLKCILPGVQACDNVKKLYVNTFIHWLDDDFCRVLKENRTINEFYISLRVGFPCELVDSLCANTTIKRLVLDLYGSTSPCEYQFVSDEIFKHDYDDVPCLLIEDASAQIINENQCVTELSIKWQYSPGVDGNNYVLAKALSKNITLKKFEISTCFEVDDADAFSLMLSKNSTLKELQFLKECTFNLATQKIQEIFDILSSSLSSNRTLLKMYIALPHSFQHRNEVITACANDDRLHCEWYESNSQLY